MPLVAAALLISACRSRKGAAASCAAAGAVFILSLGGAAGIWRFEGPLRALKLLAWLSEEQRPAEEPGLRPLVHALVRARSQRVPTTEAPSPRVGPFILNDALFG